MNLETLQTTSLPAGHLPVIRGCMDLLGFKEVIDGRLPKHDLAKVSDAECVMALVVDILSGRLALWRMDKWLEKLDVELVMGKGVEPGWFHDTRLGQCLDRIDAVGTDTLLGEIVTRYLQRPERVSEYSVHLDTTSVSVHGAYDVDVSPIPTFGYSKDRRPDLKQLIFGLSVHGAVGIPLTMSVTAGNTSEQASNRDHLAKLATLLPQRDQITIVADSKLVDAETLGQLFRSGLHVISLVPNTFKVRKELVDQAWSDLPEVGSWPILAQQPGKKKAAPPQHYRGRSYRRTIPIKLGRNDAGEPIVSEESLRLLVVCSDRLAARFERSLPDKLKREQASFEKQRKKHLKRDFACEQDARSTAERLTKKLALHTPHISVSQVERTRKRARSGRPRKDEPEPTEVVWTVDISLTPDQAAIDKKRRRASCFVLVSDWDQEEWDDARVLAEYRHQSLIEGHTGFRWMKGPAAVAPVMLNTPHRIRALGLVFVLALMVRNFFQFTLRARMKQRGRGIKHPFRKKEDDNLTTEMALVWFDGINVVFVKLPGIDWTRTTPTLCDEARDILQLIGIKEEIYARPPPR